MAPVVRENENAGHLDLLGVSCLVLTRVAIAATRPEIKTLLPAVRELARALTQLAANPGDRPTRQSAVDRVLAVAGGLPETQGPPGSTLVAAIGALRMVVTDVMLFAGVDAEEAVEAVRKGAGKLTVPTPPPAARFPFGSRRPDSSS